MNKKDYDKKIIKIMIEYHCRKRHGSKTLCNECLSLLEYANKRIEMCPLEENKVSCRKCVIHCYAPSRKEQIRKVMRFSGPRMIFNHPVIAIKHLIKEKFEK